MATHRCYACRCCDRVLPAWLLVARRPDGAMLLHHLSQHHPDQMGPYLERMRVVRTGVSKICVCMEGHQTMANLPTSTLTVLHGAARGCRPTRAADRDPYRLVYAGAPGATGL